MLILLLVAAFLGLSMGSAGIGFNELWQSLSGKTGSNSMLPAIIWHIRFPRVVLAALVGATLSLGGLVFQALLRNPLAEPYILGISGGSAVGAIIGILLGMSRFPGVSLSAFAGSIATLILILLVSSGQTILKKDSLLLSGVMVNAFCSAVIIFLLSITRDSKLHNIIFWLMGDLSITGAKTVIALAATLFPFFIIIFWLSNSMNLLITGKELAKTSGINIKAITIALLVITSLIVSATVSHCGLIGFVGLVIPHLLRLVFGPDHRILVPACILGGGAYMIFCDLLARVLPAQGEMPSGVITAMIGAPLFIFLLKRTKQ
ncbi:MAG TPA: iron ABC transporter permease [Desulfobacteraceae bacterium]|nr:iron ABC transporter permease [Desulfobacteraceae bacterium]